MLWAMDPMLRSNPSVGMPLDLCFLPRDLCQVTSKRRIEAGCEAFLALRDGFAQINL
jgi:putative proteasome-type protease